MKYIKRECKLLLSNRTIAIILLIVFSLSILISYDAYAWYEVDIPASVLAKASEVRQEHGKVAITVWSSNYHVLDSSGLRVDGGSFYVGNYDDVHYYTMSGDYIKTEQKSSNVSLGNISSETALVTGVDGVDDYKEYQLADKIDFNRDGSLSVVSSYPVVVLDKSIRLDIEGGTALGSIAVYEKTDTVNPIKYVNVMGLSSTQIALGYIDVELGNGDFVIRNNTTLDLSYTEGNQYLAVEYYPSYYFASSGSTVLIDLISYEDDDYMTSLVYGQNNGFSYIRHLKEDSVTGVGDIVSYNDVSSIELQAGYKHYLEFNNKDTATTLNEYYYFSSDVVPETPDKMIPIDSFEDESFIGEIFSIYDEMIIGDDENYITFKFTDTTDFGADEAYFRFVVDADAQYYVVEKRLNPIEGQYNVEKVRLVGNDKAFSLLFSQLDTSDLIEFYQVSGRATMKIPEGIDGSDYTIVKGYTDFSLSDNLGTDTTYSDYYDEIINTDLNGDGTITDAMEVINNDGISFNNLPSITDGLQSVQQLGNQSMTFFTLISGFMTAMPYPVPQVFTSVLIAGAAMFILKIVRG